MNTQSLTVSLLPFTLLLSAIFAVLKLFGVITWGWVWVVSPIWLPWLTGVVAVVLIGSFVTLLAVFGLIPRSERRF